MRIDAPAAEIVRRNLYARCMALSIITTFSHQNDVLLKRLSRHREEGGLE